ncbi:MAG: DUF971 domain-containing protein [Verrucomicrobia bacterium]|nr:DUF971 domain-containing protein [Verrucomicrobiota bacterium]
MRLSPLHIALVGNEFAIAWSDGAESYLELEYLRRNCPCAACCGESDVLGRVSKTEVRYTPASFRLRNWEVSGYAIQPVWEDGHKTGLYTFAFLQQLGSTQSPGGGAPSQCA